MKDLPIGDIIHVPQQRLVDAGLASDKDVDKVPAVKEMATEAGLKWLAAHEAEYRNISSLALEPRVFRGSVACKDGTVLLEGNTAVSSMRLITLRAPQG